MDYDYSITKKEKPQSRLPRVLFFILIILIGVFVRNVLLQKKTLPAQPPIKKISKSQLQKKEELLNKIREIINNKPGSYSVFVSDFTTNDSFGINENTIFTGASVNKIEVLAALYFLAGQGKINLDEAITIQQEDIQDYGTGSMRYENPGAVYSIKTLARLMMEKSDNTATHIIGDQVIGMDKIQNLVDQWALKQTNMLNNKTSNTDQEKLLRMMYEGKIAKPPLTAEMLDFMNDSDFEDRIPALLPKEIKVYHKIGNEIRNTHDVGIVDLPNRPYYIGVFTVDNSDEQDAIKIIAQISKLVFEYMKGL